MILKSEAHEKNNRQAYWSIIFLIMPNIKTKKGGY